MKTLTKFKNTNLWSKARTLRTRLRQVQELSQLDDGRTSYAQYGEDIIISGVFSRLGLQQITYLDIGAHHSRFLSNTYFFYRAGGHGVCVEPNPELFAEIRSQRVRDICLNVGVGFDGAKEAEFYMMNSALLSTFSKEDAEQLQMYQGHTLKKVIKLPLEPINDIIAKHFKKAPTLISIDVEGLDLAILTSLDFTCFRPVVLCVETIVYTPGREIEKRNDIIDFLAAKNYFVYADTSCNSIFVDRDKWFGEACSAEKLQTL